MNTAKNVTRMLALAFLVFAVLPASADVRRRWFLDFELGVPRDVVNLPRKDPTSTEYKSERMYIQNKPELFQYQDRLGKTTLVWFVPFTLKNPSTDQYVPLTIDMMLHTDQGKDFHHDILRSDPSVPARGKYYSSVIQEPDLEVKIVSHVEKLGNRNEEMQRERLMELKKENKYLNPSDLRRKRILKPGEEVVGLAIFRDVDRSSDTLELSVDGLVDVAKITKVERDRVHYAYENRVLHMFFDVPGDEFNKVSDYVSAAIPRAKKWEVHQVGPAGDKEVLPKLIDALAAEDPTLDPALKKILPVVVYGPNVRRGAHEALKKLTGESYPFDADKAPSDPENLNTIRLYREWWTRNSEKLVYNDIQNRFEIKPIEVPGTGEGKPAAPVAPAAPAVPAAPAAPATPPPAK